MNTDFILEKNNEIEQQILDNLSEMTHDAYDLLPRIEVTWQQWVMINNMASSYSSAYFQERIFRINSLLFKVTVK